MRKHIILLLLYIFSGLIGTASATTTATFSSASISGCPDCVATDPVSGLEATGKGLALTLKGLQIDNGVALSMPGYLFDTSTVGMKINSKTYAFNRVHAPITLGFYAYKNGVQVGDTTVIVRAGLGGNVNLSADQRFKGIDKLVISIVSNPYKLETYLIGLVFESAPAL